LSSYIFLQRYSTGGYLLSLRLDAIRKCLTIYLAVLCAYVNRPLNSLFSSVNTHGPSILLLLFCNLQNLVRTVLVCWASRDSPEEVLQWTATKYYYLSNHTIIITINSLFFSRIENGSRWQCAAAEESIPIDWPSTVFH